MSTGSPAVDASGVLKTPASSSNTRVMLENLFMVVPVVECRLLNWNQAVSFCLIADERDECVTDNSYTRKQS